MIVGVVGCGYWGSKHVRVLSELPSVDGVAIIEPSRVRREALAAAFKSARPFSRLEDALDEVDALVIATPPSTHLDLGLVALKAGKHVLIEKPLATSVEGGRRLVDEAKARDLVLMVGHIFEYNPVVVELRNRIGRGELGRVQHVDAARLGLGLYQSDVNVVWDLATHDVSILNYLFGEVPTRVAAWGSRLSNDSVEDVAYLKLVYGAAGVTAHVHVSWLDPAKVRRITVVGSQKMAVYSDTAPEARLRIYDKGVHQRDGAPAHQAPLSYRYGDIVSPHIPFDEPLMIEDAHFVDSAATGSPTRTDGQNGLAVLAVLEAADLAMKLGREVPVQTDGPRPEGVLAAGPLRKG